MRQVELADVAASGVVTIQAGLLLTILAIMLLALIGTCESSGAAPPIPCDVETGCTPPLLSGDGGAADTLPHGLPIRPASAWRDMYAEVERCAGLAGDFDAVRWAVVDAPMRGAQGAIHGYTRDDRIVLVADEMTYVRHEMLHHILMTAGWRPHRLRPGERYSIADLHPMPLFGLCTRGA